MAFEKETAGGGGVHPLNPVVDTITLDPAAAPVVLAEGQMQYNAEDDTIELGVGEAGVVLQIGQENYIRARNSTGGQIDNGEVVFISGSTGNRPNINLAQANNPDEKNLIGVATHNIPDNTDGYVTTFGLVRDINTNAFTEGAIVYLDPAVAGGLTETKPSDPNYCVQVGVIVRKHNNQGVLLVNVKELNLKAQLNEIEVVNNTGEILVKGEVVYISGGDTNIPEVSLAQADAVGTKDALGIVSANIAIGDPGFVTAFGLVTGLNTDSYVVGDQLYLDAAAAGALTDTIPTDPNYAVYVCVVITKDASDGVVCVAIKEVSTATGGAEPYGEIYVNNNGTPTTINTVNVWEEVTVMDDSGLLSGITRSTNNLVLSAGSDGIYQVNAAMSATPAETARNYEFAISVNDAIITKSMSRNYSTNLEAWSSGLCELLTLQEGDEVTLEVRNITGDDDITIIHATVTLHKVA